MFICSECGTKYKIMPKFCDCGNDIFIEEKETETEPKIQDIEIPQQQPRRKGRGKVEALSPAAIGGFVFCLVLSLIVLFFIGNPKKEITPEENSQEKKVEIVADIPSIDSYWDNTIAKSESKKEIKEEPEEKPIIDMVPKFVQNILPQETKPVQPAKKITVKTIPPTQTTQNKKPQITKSSKVQQQTKQVQQTNPQAQAITNRIKNNIQYNTQTQSTNTFSQNIPAPQPKQTQTQQTIPKTTPTTQITQNQNIQKTTTQTSVHQPAPTPAVKTKSQTALTKELNTYKASLRNTIGRKIDFTKVIGDGDCALTFKINSSGRLISKAFTKQSSNITLNDAVFNAMNSITSYNAPPEGYKGEAMNLRIRFYNGNFEITLN